MTHPVSARRRSQVSQAPPKAPRSVVTFVTGLVAASNHFETEIALETVASPYDLAVRVAFSRRAPRVPMRRHRF
jgi:hypothetical protein